MKKEEWINGIMESVSEIREAEPNSYLYSKIQNRLNNQQDNNMELVYKFRFAWVAVIFIIVSINVSALFLYTSKSHRQKEVAVFKDLSNEMISGTTYNY
jgi:hypothetical protein